MNTENNNVELEVNDRFNKYQSNYLKKLEENYIEEHGEKVLREHGHNIPILGDSSAFSGVCFILILLSVTVQRSYQYVYTIKTFRVDEIGHIFLFSLNNITSTDFFSFRV